MSGYHEPRLYFTTTGDQVGTALKLGGGDGMQGCSFQTYPDGTYACTLKVEVTNDPQAALDIINSTSLAKWTDITSMINDERAIVHPAGGGEDGIIIIGNSLVGWIRLSTTSSSGTGNCPVYLRGG